MTKMGLQTIILADFWKKKKRKTKKKMVEGRFRKLIKTQIFPNGCPRLTEMRQVGGGFFPQKAWRDRVLYM